MELRGRSHWHFIQAIKGGEVIRVINVDTKGQTEIKFKSVNNVYDTEVVQVQNPVPIVNLRDDLGVSPFKSPRVKMESLDQVDDVENGTDQDDFSFSRTTLKEFMKRCKIKKRKCSPSVDKCEGNAGARSSVKQFQEDDCDLDVPLSSWKAKLFKVKRRRKCSVKRVPNSQNLLAIVKYVAENSGQSSDNWLAPLDIKVEACEMDYSDSQDMSCAAADCNCNWSEPVDSCPSTDNDVPVAVDSSTLEAGVSLYPTIEAHPCGVNEVSYEYMEDNRPNFVGGFPCWDIIEVNSPEAIDIQLEDSMDTLEDINEEGCGVLPLAYDLSSCSLMMDNASDMHHISLSSSSNHDPQTCSWYQSEVPEMTNSTQYLTEKYGTIDQSPLEYRNPVYHKLGNGASTWEIAKIDGPGTSHSQCLDPSCYNEQGYIKSQVPIAIISESTSPTLVHSSYTVECLERNTFGPKISLDTTLDSQVKVPARAIENDSGSLQYTVQANTYLPYVKTNDSCMEESSDNTLPELTILENTNPHGSQYINLAGTKSQIKACDMAINYDSQILEYRDQGSKCSIEDSKNSHIPEPEYNSIVPSGNSYASCIRESCYSAAQNSISGENKDPSVRSDDVDCPGDTSDEPILSGKLSDPVHSKQQHPPERLFSNRKVISPSIQRKLCQAMESTELDEDHQPGRKEKYYFGIHSNHRILKAEGMNHLKIPRSTTNTKQTLRKPKHDQTGNGTENFSKVSDHGCFLCNSEAGWFCSQNCSQSAINFSKQQMKDIQSVASKLTKELNSMKDIVKNMWAASANTSFKQQYTTQVKTALENATRVEETSKQRLMHMSRNCTRFCRVMELAEDSSAASGNASDPNSKKRKIAFADEAGGKLCDVMVTKDDEKCLETRSVSQELLAE